MSKFRVGDRVRCVDPGTGKYLTAGKTYVIDHLHANDASVYVKDDTSRVCDYYAARFVLAPPLPPRDLNPFEWDPQAEVSNNACRTTYVHAGNRITAFARFLWWWQGLDLGAVRWGRTPDTVTVVLPRKDAEFFARHDFAAAPNASVSAACRAALDGEAR